MKFIFKKYKKIRYKILRLINFDAEITNIINKENIKNEAFKSKEKIIEDNNHSGNDIVVSLTTYNTRIRSLFYTLESLSKQTIKANKVVLWLDKNEFNESNLPRYLFKYMDRGLSIEYCDNFKSFKKIIPSLIEFKDANIITIDDDIIYSPYLIEDLISEHKKKPNAIIGCRAHEIIRNEHGIILPYNKWKQDIKTNVNSKNIFITTGGGTLFPPKCISEEYLNYESIVDCCEFADDVWVKFMSIFNKVECIKVSTNEQFSKSNIFINVDDDLALTNYNVIQNGNDIAIKKMEKKYNVEI